MEQNLHDSQQYFQVLEQRMQAIQHRNQTRQNETNALQETLNALTESILEILHIPTVHHRLLSSPAIPER